ncbi:hypothetical protein NE857_09145 [Nocardiopsis exhalans]|uniref:Uncharacterized protein n=1 Tax=Nocardiopsis exhalans TaxID=163604 RepID=A0ABY5DF73_9ACTN|nr:hypothetical protein [Nocardiopsis exhalans]USY21747.1 hypothetical protein NE857_09145 [Nocardiopsis exhalans]
MAEEFQPLRMWHPQREGQTRLARTPAERVRLAADGWRPRVPVSLTTTSLTPNRKGQ